MFDSNILIYLISSYLEKINDYLKFRLLNKEIKEKLDKLLITQHIYIRKKNIPDFFLEKLVNVTMGRNKISNKLIEVKYLDCQSSYIKHIPNQLEKLEILNCSWNKSIKVIPEFKQLRKLECSGTSIRALPKCLKNIKDLTCSYNILFGSIPKTYKELEILNCAWSNCGNIPYFEKLKSLTCATINDLSIQLEEYPNLEFIMTTNYILPDKFKKIKKIILSKDEANKTIHTYETLEQLDCIESSVATINPLPKLKYLNITKCTNILYLPEDLPSLEILICQDTLINKLPKYKTLKKLDCRDTLIETIPDELDQLEYIDCRGSKITKIPILPKLRILKYDCKNVIELNKYPNLIMINGNVIRNLQC